MIAQWFQNLWQTKNTEDSPTKILIIEDSRVDAQMIKKAVDVCGFKALMAYNGRTGIQMAKLYQPNLIVLDYHLPDTNGGQVLKEIRADKDTLSESVMVLTILNQPGVILDSFANGADQYFTKPISVSLLAKQIQVMLRYPHEQ